MNPAVIAQALGKRYSRYHADRPRTIMEAALAGHRRMKAASHFWALRDINFTVAPGQMLGIIGHNGAGKSTLLQLLSGVVRADEGQVQVTGRIGALLDLGASFHPDLTGRENVFVSAIVAGLTRREVMGRFDAIVEFAELEAFIDNPVRTYSTGMQMRLAFAVAIHTEPDVLLVDEFLSVGDGAFQVKCLDRIAHLKANGCAVVLISHNVEQIQQLCDQALWLKQGQVEAYGDPEVVAVRYAGIVDLQAQAKKFRSYSQAVELMEVKLLNSQNVVVAEIQSGDLLKIEIEYQSLQQFQNVIFSVSVSDENGQIYFNTNTSTSALVIPLSVESGKIRLCVDRLDLSGGSYYVNAGIFAPDWSETYDYHWHRHPFQITWTPNEQSMLCPPRRWEIVNSPISLDLTQQK
ncbi:MAG: ABC transporter ATP-binding protein [Leptolyngbyaceae cyanobacterium CSU_1_3]|nr:ABC transporter ATP-binding protein [Leptolyngbyaceae cyanobacterium CSU_1_3]